MTLLDMIETVSVSNEQDKTVLKEKMERVLSQAVEKKLIDDFYVVCDDRNNKRDGEITCDIFIKEDPSDCYKNITQIVVFKPQTT